MNWVGMWQYSWVGVSTACRWLICTLLGAKSIVIFSTIHFLDNPAHNIAHVVVIVFFTVVFIKFLVPRMSCQVFGTDTSC